MRGGYLYEGGALWFDADGRLVIWERGVTVARWSRAGDELTLIRDGEPTRWIVYSEGEDHATLVAGEQAMLLTRFQPRWSAEDTRAALQRSWRQLFAPDGEFVYFRPWAPTLDLHERLDTITVDWDGALIRVGDEAMMVVGLSDRLMTLYEHEAHVWSETAARREDELDALRRALLGSWRLLLPTKALAHVHFEFAADQVSYALPDGRKTAPWRLEPDGRHVVIDERVALLLLGPPDALSLALPDSLIRGGTVLARDEAPSPTAWEGDWVIRRSGRLEPDVAETFALMPIRSGVHEPELDLRTLMWSVTRRARAFDPSEVSPDGRLVFGKRTWRWLKTDGDTRLLIAADASVIEVGRELAPPPAAKELVGAWRVMAWPRVFLDGHAFLPAPSLILTDDGTYSLSALHELAAASGSWSWGDGTLVLEGLFTVELSALGRYAWQGTNEDGREVLVVRAAP